MSWKFNVLSDGAWASNAQRFATQDEAARAGVELMTRWSVPEGIATEESDEVVNYEFPEGTDRPRPFHPRS